MTDLIGRQTAIDALLEKGQKSRRYKLGEIWELNFDEIREALATVPSTQLKKGKWIPVSERLPKELINPVTSDFCEYLCTIKIDDDYYVRTYKFGDMHWWHALRMMDEYVIAWMELPEPYKGES